MIVRSVIRGVGAYLPERIVTNVELAVRVDTTDHIDACVAQIMAALHQRAMLGHSP